MVLEEKCRRMENGLNENVAEVIMQKESIKDVIDTMRTHDTLLHERLAPTSPTYADLAAGRQSLGDGGVHPGGSNGTRPGTLKQHSKPTDNNSKKHTSVQQQNNGGPKRLVGAKASVCRISLLINGQQLAEMVSQCRPTHRGGSVFRNVAIVTLHGAPPPTRDFFFSRVCKNTVDMEFQKLITEKGLNDFILTLVSNSEAKFKSYKISFTINEQDKVLVADYGPCMCVQRWRVRSRVRTNSEDIKGASSYHGE